MPEEKDKKQPPPPDSKNTDTVTSEDRNAWNDYYDYLKQKGLGGSKDLDQGDGADNAGIKTLQQYIKDVKDGKVIIKDEQGNPKPVSNTTLTVEKIPAIQKDFAKYRQFAIDDIKAGNGKYAEGVNENNFMKELSIVDGVPGSKTTRHKFPPKYVIEMGKKENKGFAKQGDSMSNLYK